MYASQPQVAALIGYDGQPLVAVGPAGPPPPVDLPVIRYPERDRRQNRRRRGGRRVPERAEPSLPTRSLRAGLKVVVLEEGPPIHGGDIVGHTAPWSASSSSTVTGA